MTAAQIVVVVSSLLSIVSWGILATRLPMTETQRFGRADRWTAILLVIGYGGPMLGGLTVLFLIFLT